MSAETPFSAEDALNSIMAMREMANTLMEMKTLHPKLYPGDNSLWAKDIEQLSHIIKQYDRLIIQLMEINLKQGELMDQMAERMEAVLKGSA